MLTTLAALPLLVAAPQEVSPQGRLLEPGQPRAVTSPLGGATATVESSAGDPHGLELQLGVRLASGRAWSVPGLAGDGFLVGERGELVVLDAGHRPGPAIVRLVDPGGRLSAELSVPGLRDAVLSSDGAALVFGSRDGVTRLDLDGSNARQAPALRSFAAGPRGLLAGVEPSTGALWVQGEFGRVLPGVRELAFDDAGLALYALTDQGLWLDRAPFDGVPDRRWSAPAGLRLVDLQVRGQAVRVGARRAFNGASQGVLLAPGPGPGLHTLSVGGITPTVAAETHAVPLGQLPWPLGTAGPTTVGNTYGEYQRYGNTPYMHPGVDVMGDPGQPVFAMADGVVKAVLTTSGQWHWRVATGQAGGGSSTGYLYAHLDLPTIAVQVGDVVSAGQYLGDLVEWPVANFTHTHVARIQDSGVQWQGDWLCTDNPHLDFWPHSDASGPVFEDAVPGQALAFCANESSSYLDPDALSGQVDIIAHVSDQVGTSWDCSVQTLRYWILPAADPANPVVDGRLAFHADMALDTYFDGPVDPFLVGLLYKEDSTCDTDGDYGSREFFHVLTNSDGDQVYEASDAAEAWDTTQVPNGDYVIRVQAWDVAGNGGLTSMTVTVSN